MYRQIGYLPLAVGGSSQYDLPFYGLHLIINLEILP